MHTQCDSHLLFHFHSAPKWKVSFMMSMSLLSRPSSPLSNTIKAVDLFHLFFTTALMGEIVEQTNGYAGSILGEGTAFDEVMDTDIWAFLLGSASSWDSVKSLLFTTAGALIPHYCPAISDHINSSQFMFIWCFFHFINSASAMTPSCHQIACGKSAQSSQLWWLPAAHPVCKSLPGQKPYS